MGGGGEGADGGYSLSFSSWKHNLLCIHNFVLSSEQIISVFYLYPDSWMFVRQKNSSSLPARQLSGILRHLNYLVNPIILVVDNFC